jgi:putative peptide zinc metalloprotease protein
MDTATSPSLERRKKVQVRLRADLSIEPQTFEGRTCYVVKDPISLRYYRFKEREHFLIRLMDGNHTLDEAQKEYERHFRPARLSLEEIEGFARLLLSAGLAQNDSARTGSRLFEQYRQHQRRRRLLAWTQLLYIQFPIFDPDKLLTRLLRRLRWVFTKGFVLASVGVMLIALLLVATHFDAFRSRLPSFQDLFHFRKIVLLWVALGAVKVLHEFGHGLSCKAFGGEVHEMGILFLCLFPCLYCNVTDAWTLPSKWRRILVSFAGIYVELLVASLATLVWWAAPAEPLLGQFCLSLMVVCSVNTVVFNANPLLRYDGYYMMADWLEIPNLRERSSRFLKNLALEHGLGIEMPVESTMARWRRLLFISYAVASYAYRWLVTFGVIWFMYRLLKPYNLGAVGALLGVLSAASMLGWPLYRFIQDIRRQGRLPQMNQWRVFRSIGVVAALLLAACVVPLPISRIRQTALVQLQPDATEKIFVPAAAVLERLYVRDGQVVQQNDILAEFRSLDLETQREESVSDYEIRTMQLQFLQDRAAVANSAADRAQIEVARAAAAGERALCGRQIEVFDRMVKLLVVRAPRAGVVIDPPRLDEVGKLWEQDNPFCTIGDPARLRALLPVSPADYRLLKEELSRDPALCVAICMPGPNIDDCRGHITRLPESEATEVPLSLTTHGGGPLSAEPTARPGAYVPLTQQYLVPADIEAAGARLYPGTLAQVQVRCRWRPLAWLLWRTVASTFDVGLL